VDIEEGEINYGSLLTEWKVSILLRTMEIVYDLIKDGGKNEDIRLAICKTGIAHNLIILALGELPGNETSKFALFLLGLLTYQCRPAQELLESFNFDRLRSGVLESAIVRLLRIVLYEGDELKRQIANDCLQKFLYDNKEGQLFIASTIKAPTLISSSAEEGMLCGITLANAILSFDKPKQHLAESFHGAAILSSIIKKNDKCKDILLEIPYEVTKGKRPISFFECFVKATIQATRSRSHETLSLGLLQLLCYWLHGSSNSTRKFMQNTSNLLFFIETVTKSLDYATVHIQGLSSLILGILCMEFEEDPDDSLGGYTKEGLIETITKRVGVNRLNTLYNNLAATNEFNIALYNNSSKFFETIPAEPIHFNVYDYNFVTFAKEVHDSIVNFFSNSERGKDQNVNIQRPLANGTEKRVKSPLATASPIDESAMNKLKEVIEQQENELNRSKEEISRLVISLEESKKRIEMLQQQLQESEKNQEKLNEKQRTLSQKEQTYEEEKKKLQQTIDQLKHEIENQKSELANRDAIAEQKIKALNSQLQNKEQELESLAISYEQMQQYMEEKEKDVSKHQKLWKEEEAKAKKFKQEKESLQLQLDRMQQQLGSIQKVETELLDLKSYQEQQEEQHRQQLQQKDSQINQLRQQLAELQHEYNELKQRQQLEEYMSKSNQSVNEELERTKRLLQERDQVMLQLKMQLDTQAGELQQLRDEILQKDKKIEDLEHDNDDMMDIVEQLENKLSALMGDNTNAGKE